MSNTVIMQPHQQGDILSGWQGSNLVVDGWKIDYAGSGEGRLVRADEHQRKAYRDSIQVTYNGTRDRGTLRWGCSLLNIEHGKQKDFELSWEVPYPRAGFKFNEESFTSAVRKVNSLIPAECIAKIDKRNREESERELQRILKENNKKRNMKDFIDSINDVYTYKFEEDSYRSSKEPATIAQLAGLYKFRSANKRLMVRPGNEATSFQLDISLKNLDRHQAAEVINLLQKQLTVSKNT